MKKFSILTVAAIVTFSFTACDGNKKEEKTEERVERVQTQILQQKEISREINLATTLQGYETMNIASSISGIIEHIYVEVGDKVSQGQLLVRMDPTQYTNTKLAYANLGVEMERMEALKQAGSISQQNYDKTKVQYDQTKETLALYETNTFVKAQYSGYISAKNFEDGELCAGQPILTLTQINFLKALINIPEAYFPFVKVGMPISIVSGIYPNKTFNGTIEIVYPTVDVNSHTFTIKVKIPNAQELLRPGMYVHTTIPVGKAKTLIAPYQAVLKLIGSNDRYVFLNNNGRAKRVAVTLGQRFDENVEIISEEIKEGDELVVTGQARLIDGVKLNVINDFNAQQ